MNNKNTNCFEGKVKCEQCKCYLDKSDAQEVQYSSWSFYFCAEHKKPYTKAIFMGSDVVHFFAEIEVNSDGTPVGYVKPAPKKKPKKS